MMKKAREGKPEALGPVKLLDGYKDRLLDVAPLWRHVERELFSLADDSGYARLETPLLEEARLFLPWHGGEELSPEVVTVSMNGIEAALRPEKLLPLSRAFLEHGFATQPLPMKLMAYGPSLRNVRTAVGRYRQFHTFDFAVFGDDKPMADAQLIASLYVLLDTLHLPFTLHLNSQGHDQCRKEYEKKLNDYYRTRKSDLCDVSKASLPKDPLSVLLCAEPSCSRLAREAPQMIDHLCEEDRLHFSSVLEYLDAVDVAYLMDHLLFRRAPVTNRTVFAFRVALPDGRPLTLASGGRHDELLAKLGGERMPLLHCALGLERVVLALKEHGISVPDAGGPELFLAHIGEEARKKALQLFFTLRKESVRVAENLSREGMKVQMDAATQSGVKYALILGQKEIMDGTILIRDMENGIQEVVDFQKVVPEMKKRLVKNGAGGTVIQVPATEPMIEPVRKSAPATDPLPRDGDPVDDVPPDEEPQEPNGQETLFSGFDKDHEA